MEIPGQISAEIDSQALVRRQQWLIEQGLMQRDGNDVLFRKDILGCSPATGSAAGRNPA